MSVDGKVPEGTNLSYKDKIVTLVNGSIIIGRVLVEDDYQEAEALCVYRPMEIFDDDQSIFMRKWIPPSDDDVYYIPFNKIMTVSAPNKLVHDSFSKMIKGDYSVYYPDRDMNVQDDDEDLINEELTKPQLH